MIMGSCSAHVFIPQSCGISSEDHDTWGMILLLYTRVQLNTENVNVTLETYRGNMYYTLLNQADIMGWPTSLEITKCD